MIISPPFLPAEGLTVPAEKWKTDPMMDKVDEFELSHSGVFPVASDRRWHPGMHLVPYGGLGQKEPVRAIADGVVVAYRVAKHAISDGQKKSDGTDALNSNTGFVLLKHTTDTGEGRTITFYSLYMHLLDLVSTQVLVPQPEASQAPQESSPNALPAWLLAETNDVQPGGTKKVYRKDQLGYVGQYQGEAHLHFEIFMTEADFTAWFEQEGHKVGLGNTHPETPASKDYWGHTYYVIPEKAAFVSVPPGMASLKTEGRSPKAFFPALDAGTLGDGNTLYVQTYFSRGERFMRAWIDRGDGKLVSLTPDEPIKDRFDEYEYLLHERATKLYEACPSDGYEMLRFGRILSTDTPTLPAEMRATWLAVPFEQGKVGYIDVNLRTVKKLSDADFPFFMNWQKIEDGHTPFDEAGMCGYDELCRITGVTDIQSPDASTLQEFSHEESLKSYVQRQAAVRAKLRGFVCHAKSEWDASNNDDRYGGLNGPEGFFGKRKDADPDGYTRFIDFVKQSQFMGKIQAPLGEGSKFLFFHPLAFIRHFRKCGWVNTFEMAQCFPRQLQHLQLTAFHESKMLWAPAFERAGRWVKAFNLGTRKYGISQANIRLVHLFSHVVPETGNLSLVKEVGGERARYAPYYGRGLIQLTHLENYEDYGKFRNFAHENAGSTYSSLKWNPDDLIAKDNSGHHNYENCVDSACFYIVKRNNMLSHLDAGVTQDAVIVASKDVNGYVAIENLNGLDARLQSVIYLVNILLDKVYDHNKISITFDWRRNSKKEPVLDDQGKPKIKDGKPVTKFYKTTHTIEASILRQKPSEQ